MSGSLHESRRVRIETALRRRDPHAFVTLTEPTRDDLRWIVSAEVCGVSLRRESVIADGALDALTVACGLRRDGSDPAADIDREQSIQTASQLRAQEANRHAWPAPIATAEMARVQAEDWRRGDRVQVKVSGIYGWLEDLWNDGTWTVEEDTPGIGLGQYKMDDLVMVERSGRR